jgi:glutamate-1-semialdehyde 2,1-aminomutase
MTQAFDPISEYRSRTRRSAEWFEAACEHLPAGVTGNVKFYEPYPVYAKRAKGSHLWDLDGHDYVDYLLCFGPLILGHGHPKVLDAVRRQIEQDGTLIFGAPHALEVRMAERLKRIFPFADRVRFANSGLEATLHALRIARGFRRRATVAKFEGHYHGSYDEVLVSLTPAAGKYGSNDAPVGVPGSVSTTPGELANTLVLPYNDLDATVRLLRSRADELAAVIVEPVARGFIPADREFLKGLRETTAGLGIPLVFDEIMSAFRMETFGAAQTVFGIDPDLMCLGKILGGGFPCGAFLGKADLMDMVNPLTKSSEERVFHGGTFNGHPTVLAAGLATLDILEEPRTYERINETTQHLRAGLDELFDRLGFVARTEGVGSTFNVRFSNVPALDYRSAARTDAKLRQLFDFGLLARGIHLHPDKPFYLSTAHERADVDRTLAAAEDVLRRIRDAA